MNFWRGKRLVITAGPTREALDPVRFLSNESSGRMGWALARAAKTAGAQVTLVHGPVGLENLAGVRRVPVTSAREMLAATLKASRGAAAVIGAAAVADWRPAVYSRRKIKKEGTAPVIRLTRNPDILGTLAARRPGLATAGFALETDDLLARARRKLLTKKLTVVVANPPSSLGGDRTRAWILTRRGTAAAFSGTKDALAGRILQVLGGELHGK